MSCNCLKDLIGCPFKVHGRSKEDGFDCYGLAIEVLKRNGIHLQDAFYESLDSSVQIYEKQVASIPSKQLDRPEDLCIIVLNIFGQPKHIAVYIGDGMIIHATRQGVLVEPLRRYEKRVVGYYKVSNN